MKEKDEKLGQEPAFPLDKESSDMITGGYGMDERYLGVSKRFYAACAAIQGILSRPNSGGMKTIVSDSYAFADELLKQEQL